VFRTNQSYDRWWEARKVWGTILNRVRDITTQAAVFIPEEDYQLREGVRNWSIAFVRTLEAHLQVCVCVSCTSAKLSCQCGGFLCFVSNLFTQGPRGNASQAEYAMPTTLYQNKLAVPDLRMPYVTPFLEQVIREHCISHVPPSMCPPGPAGDA
jgi:hypothetical protein